jgi:protein involved in polysaccharide export with SLBB domain
VENWLWEIKAVGGTQHIESDFSIGRTLSLHPGNNSDTLPCWQSGPHHDYLPQGACFVRPPARLIVAAVDLPATHRATRTMKTLLRRFVLLAYALALSVAEAAAQTPASSSSEQVTLAPGDSIRVVVWRKPEMSGDFIVGADGTITHPLYRAVRVGGIPFATAQSNLRTFLARFEQDPQFVAEPLVRIAVSGEVGRPQVYALRPETTIAEAVAQAGGPRETANRDRVRVLRKDSSGRQREFYVDLLDPEGSSSALRVHSGDQIVVDRRRSFFREIFLPGLSVIGSAASIYLVIDRAQRNN